MSPEKQERKIKRWTETPEARARVAETLRQLSDGYAWTWDHENGDIADGWYTNAKPLPAPVPIDPPTWEDRNVACLVTYVDGKQCLTEYRELVLPYDPEELRNIGVIWPSNMNTGFPALCRKFLPKILIVDDEHVDKMLALTSLLPKIEFNPDSILRLRDSCHNADSNLPGR